MKLVIDTNILLSALIKNSTTRKILVESGWTFYYPEISFHEVRKYQKLVLKKSGMNIEEYSRLLNQLLEFVILIPDERIKTHLKEANLILGEIDLDDVVFLSAAMGMKHVKIWSDDKHFQQQEKVIVLNSKEVSLLFFEK